MSYFIYILKSQRQDGYYIDSSEDPERRLVYHNSIEKGFTSRYRPWEIVYKKEYESKTEAQTIERKTKSWKSKTMVDRMITREIEL